MFSIISFGWHGSRSEIYLYSDLFVIHLYSDLFVNPLFIVACFCMTEKDNSWQDYALEVVPMQYYFGNIKSITWLILF